MNLELIAHNIEKKDNGIFFSKNDSQISYPEEGNSNCLQIEQDSFWFNHRNNLIIEAVKNFSPQATFFDIGGGNGFVAKGLQDAGLEVVLVEPGIAGCFNAKSRAVENVICSTLEDAGFDASSLGAVGLFDVVEHIEDDLKFLSAVQSFLKKDGCVYITVPAYTFLWSNEDTEAGHFKRYTTQQLEKVLEKAGFKIEYSTYIFSILPLPIFLFRSIPSKLGMNKNPNELEKNKKEHSAKKGFLSGLMQRIWNWEHKKVKGVKRISFGGSCLLVARKVT